jgi:predicted alpha/beta-hydrolase family hydrolase
VLAHGASGRAASMRPHIDGLVRRGMSARAIDLPVRRAETAVDAYLAQVPPIDQAFIGGHSYGGRVASLLAARARPRGLILLSYPLHRPGKADEWRARTDHWPLIACPVLLISGESDPFARVELLRVAVGRLADAELVTYQRLGHGLGDRLNEALDVVAAWVGRLTGGATAT